VNPGIDKFSRPCCGKEHVAIPIASLASNEEELVSLGRETPRLTFRPLHVEFLRPFGAETLRLPQLAATCADSATGMWRYG